MKKKIQGLMSETIENRTMIEIMIEDIQILEMTDIRSENMIIQDDKVPHTKGMMIISLVVNIHVLLPIPKVLLPLQTQNPKEAAPETIREIIMVVEMKQDLIKNKVTLIKDKEVKYILLRKIMEVTYILTKAEISMNKEIRLNTIAPKDMNRKFKVTKKMIRGTWENQGFTKKRIMILRTGIENNRIMEIRSMRIADISKDILNKIMIDLIKKTQVEIEIESRVN